MSPLLQRTLQQIRTQHWRKTPEELDGPNDINEEFFQPLQNSNPGDCVRMAHSKKCNNKEDLFSADRDHREAIELGALNLAAFFLVK